MQQPLQRPPSWHDPLCNYVSQALWTTPVSKNYPLYSDHIDDARTGTKQISALREFHCYHLRGAICYSLPQAGRDEKGCYLLSPVKEKEGDDSQSLVIKALPYKLENLNSVPRSYVGKARHSDTHL